MAKAFSCKACGECCKGRGGIWVTLEEIKAMAQYLSMDEASFIESYCEKKNGHYYIREKEVRGETMCIFLQENGGCAVHPCKPLPCRLWPYWKGILSSEGDWRALMDFCPGLNPKVSFGEFVEEGKAYRQQILGGREDERKHL
ncbi:MAG: YkgJ family cysteine cluster protein [Candidatus Desulfofervidaceae bacterium]|nr:YkgJ family cysteine cluster protein [Candidatus Desulfofervidaceae bacterium]